MSETDGTSGGYARARAPRRLPSRRGGNSRRGSKPAERSEALARRGTPLAVAAIAVSVLIMIVISAGGPNLSVPRVYGTSGPPWWHALHFTATFTIICLWVAMALGAAGIIAGLAAVARGGRLPVQLLIGLGVLAAVVLTVLPPAGSTDAVSYAAYGRMALIGNNPYLMTPHQLAAIGDPVGHQAIQVIPGLWKGRVSVYGPVATGAEWIAARLGGGSVAHITFWLKLIELICFAAVALVLDRMLCRDPAPRLRAHLLWTANPLVLWEIVAAGHIDGLSAVFGLAAVIVVRRDMALAGAAAAGALIGLATGVKVEYALLGLAVAWACRQSIRALAAAAAGFIVIALPAYLLPGTSAIKALVTRGPGITFDTMYQLFWRPVLGYTKFDVNDVPPHLELVAYLLFAAIAVLAILRLPDRTPQFPALAPALGLSLAWLFVTAFQRPWYDVMAISLLALYTASSAKPWPGGGHEGMTSPRQSNAGGSSPSESALLDWVVIIRLLAGATVYVIAVDRPVQPHWLYDLGQFNGMWLTPVIRLLATIALVWVCVKSYPQGGAVDSAPDDVAGSKLPLAT
ncbi:MAG TPA: glycosyltransferase 87 family protein [Streptosporangiaceae bacterium]